MPEMIRPPAWDYSPRERAEEIGKGAREVVKGARAERSFATWRTG